MMLSEARTEKNLQDSKDDYQAGKALRLKEERIDYLKAKIEEEKEAVKDCLDQNFFSMAKSCMHRIEVLINKIDELR